MGKFIKPVLSVIILSLSSLPLLILAQVASGQIFAPESYYIPTLELYPSKKHMLFYMLFLWLKTLPAMIVVSIVVWLPGIIALHNNRPLALPIFLAIILSLLLQWFLLGNQAYLMASTAITALLQGCLLLLLNRIGGLFIAARNKS